MTLPIVSDLYEYWAQWPPVHETMRMAWFKDEPVSKQKGSDGVSSVGGGDVLAFTALPQVTGNWIGPPPIRPQDVIALAEQAKRG